MLEVLLWMLCPGGNAGTDSGLEQLGSTPHCIYMPLLGLGKSISLPVPLLGWTVLPAGIWARQHLQAGLQFQRVPVGATTIQTIINHWPTPPRLSLKPNTIKKPPQGPNLLGCVNDFLVKLVEPPSLGTFKARCRRQEQSVWWGISYRLAGGSNKEDFIIWECLSSRDHREWRHSDLTDLSQLLAASLLHCRCSQPIKKAKKASSKMEHVFLTFPPNFDPFLD